ncbi:MAG TPA: muconolactone Delta-isomerase family protein [Saprospiraceae bacterium]|nr:muconolactone Delta-isomerase family protein [Saprospiraceae bacterium]HND86986.1 muconolactone Delta-isomerase family protein [Saprospiraceae bacterium]HNG89419.1 muconolactone Delta-isomerase family protein [Saprospiraceae bacterium]
MEASSNQYMVDFTLPQELSDEFVERVPDHRALVHKMLLEGKILSYALSLESGKLWAVFSASSESELMQMVQRLPLTRYMKVRVSELTFFNSAHSFTPAFSMN